MIDKIDTNQISDFFEKPSASQASSAETVAGNQIDASLQTDYAGFIEQATQIPQTDTTAVQQAQQLLLSGRLESPENIRAAAENIVEFGI
jgi:hypothetical protein